MNLLIFFALPIATILLSIVLERILDIPSFVAMTFFSIYLIILFILYSTVANIDIAIGVIAIIVYSLIAYITAYIVKFIKNVLQRLVANSCNINENNLNQVNTVLSDENRITNCECKPNNNLLRISCRCNNGNSRELLTVNSNCLNENNGIDNVENSRYINENNNINDSNFQNSYKLNNIIRDTYKRNCYRR